MSTIIDQGVAERPLPFVAEGPTPSEPAPRVTAEGRAAVVRHLLILIALYALPAAVVMRPVTDADIWWHLRTGRWVIEHGGVPDTDPFSAYGQGRPWVAYSWLFEVLAHGLYQALGLTGLLAYRVVLVGAVLVALHRFVTKREPGFVRSTFLTALAFTALVPLLNERPWLFTILFVVLTLGAVLRLREGTATRAVWLLPVLFALWANLHIQFIYGLALLGLGCAAPVADALLGRPVSGRGADTVGTRAWWRLVGLTGACAAFTLANPYGARLYAVVFEYASQPVPFDVVHELQAPTFRLPSEWVFLALAGAGAVALGRRGRPTFELLLLAGTALAAFRARRDLWLLVLASLAVLTAGPRPSPGEACRFVLSRGRAAVVAAAVALVLVAVGLYRNLSERELSEAVAREFPAAAVEHVKRYGYSGPLFNDFNWGGYLIWALPEHPVSMDGRTNLHGDERIARHVNTTRGVGWEQDKELMKARLVIAENDGPLPSILRRHPRFLLLYKDRLATVFVARSAVTSDEW